MLLFMLVTFVTAFLMNGAEPVLPLIIRQRFDFSPLYLGLTYMSLPIAFVVSSPIVGWLSDRYVKRVFIVVLIFLWQIFDETTTHARFWPGDVCWHVCADCFNAQFDCNGRIAVLFGTNTRSRFVVF